MKVTGNAFLITGGGSGIGRALAHRLHDLGNHVVIAGRRQQALDEAAAGRERISTMTLDIGNRADIQRFARDVIAQHPSLNVLVNNAGIMRYEDATATRDLADAEATVTTNLLGPIHMIDGLIEHLSAQSDPAIVNVTSGLAFVPFPKAPTYSATKAALHSYTVALREQLRGRVEMIELAPPAVQTELTPGQSDHEAYQPLDEFADEVIARLQADPAQSEILVERVQPLRFAERDGQVPQVLAMFATF